MVGETGAGKSRLLTEARDLATGMRFVHSTCEAYTQQTPYAAWREPLRLLLGIGSEDSDADVLRGCVTSSSRGRATCCRGSPCLQSLSTSRSASTVEVDQLAAEARAAKLHEVVIRFLRQELVVPTLIEIEHAHVMDAASASMLEALAKELDSSAWLVLVTRRDAGGPFADSEVVQRIELGPLSAEDSQLLAQQAPDAASFLRMSSTPSSSGRAAALSSCSICFRRPPPAVAASSPTVSARPLSPGSTLWIRAIGRWFGGRRCSG